MTDILESKSPLKQIAYTPIEAAAATGRTRTRIYLRMLCYTGMRMSEPLKLAKADVNLKAATATLRNMKNERDRLVYLPEVVVEDLRQMPGGLEGAGRLFSFHASGRLRDLLKMTVAEAGVVLPRRVAFHVFCHTWATWMRQHGGLDTFDLVRTDSCARRRERAGPPGRPVAGRQKEGGVIRGKSVDNRKSAATSRRILPFTRERS